MILQKNIKYILSLLIRFRRESGCSSGGCSGGCSSGCTEGCPIGCPIAATAIIP